MARQSRSTVHHRAERQRAPVGGGHSAGGARSGATRRGGALPAQHPVPVWRRVNYPPSPGGGSMQSQEGTKSEQARHFIELMDRIRVVDDEAAEQALLDELTR